nr:uracil-DNA glycosylase family protein [Lusitaniella coriacea]
MTSDQQLNLFGNTNSEQPAPPDDFQAELIPTDAKIPIPRGTYSRMETLAEHCQNCQRCDLSQSRTQAVVGRGNPNADIMIIGEGPGQNEDEQGLPFVGKSGQLLEKILASVKLDTQKDIYIANIVKCLSAETTVVTREGEKTIGWMVENQWQGEVKSVNRYKQLVWRKVTGWHRSPLAGRRLYRLRFPGEMEGCTATGDHPILTQRGWIEVEKLESRDRVATGTPIPNTTSLPVLVTSAPNNAPLTPNGTLQRYPRNWEASQEELATTDWKPILKYPLPPQPSEQWVYCIDVEETANFITPAGVVHNCRPPGNRTPTPQEIAACKPYLLEQIRLVDPKIILLTGATALRGLTGEKRGITKVRGQWIEWEGKLCMAIFHPAYLLRNPSREKGKPKWLMWQDIQTVRNKLDEFRSKNL